MIIPLWSIATLVTEFFVTAVIFYVIWTAVSRLSFNRTLAFGVIAYEVVFNISYMVFRSIEHEKEAKSIVENSGTEALALFHGIFSLIMFISLIIFFLVADRHYAKGENYFVHHHRLTRIFLFAWGASVLSGAFLFAQLYW